MKEIIILSFVTDRFALLMENNYNTNDGWDAHRNIAKNMPVIITDISDLRDWLTPKNHTIISFKFKRIIPKNVLKQLRAKNAAFTLPAHAEVMIEYKVPGDEKVYKAFHSISNAKF